jgi:hypothetical protein
MQAGLQQRASARCYVYDSSKRALQLRACQAALYNTCRLKPSNFSSMPLSHLHDVSTLVYTHVSLLCQSLSSTLLGRT